MLSVMLAACAMALPPMFPPKQVAMTAERVELGRKLFFDERLSINGTVACATCHKPEKGYSDGEIVAVGILDRRGTRNTPTLINVGYAKQYGQQPLMFWDGRELGLPTQSLQPILNRNEMGGQSEQQVLNRLRGIPGYVTLFRQAYGQSGINRDNYGHALAAFQSTLISFDAPIDRFLVGDIEALTPDAQKGLALCEKANCFACHKAPYYTDFLIHNDGIEFAAKRQITDGGRAALAGVGQRQQDGTSNVRAFKTPTLREIGRTGPYGHHGLVPDIERYVRHHSVGGANFQGNRDRLIDPRIVPQFWNTSQERYVATFLKEAFLSDNYPLLERPVLP